MFKESIWFGFIMLLLPILITSCVITPAYRYRWWEYEPIDYNTLHLNLQPEHVYIPRYRPQPIYQYENVWYSETIRKQYQTQYQGETPDACENH